MKKFVILITLAAIIFVSCSKENGMKTPKSFTKQDLEELNKFRPNEDVLADVYHSFRSEIKESKESSFKATIDPIDRPIDEVAWLLDVVTNTELGFKNDSIEELFFDTIQIVFSNKSFTGEGLPIIDGNDLADAYLSFANTVNQNSSQGFLLWATRVEITEVGNENSEIEIIAAGGPKAFKGYLRVLPPGVDPEPFPSGTSYSMAMAAIKYNIRCHEDEFTYLASGWIIEYYNSFMKSWYNTGPGGFDNRIAHSLGSCSSGLLIGEVLNNYLMSTKEVIDENNPNGNNDKIIGHLEFYCSEFSTPIQNFKSEHMLVFNIYKFTYVGLPD